MFTSLLQMFKSSGMVFPVFYKKIVLKFFGVYYDTILSKPIYGGLRLFNMYMLTSELRSDE